jgi:hypothetical protein
MQRLLLVLLTAAVGCARQADTPGAKGVPGRTIVVGQAWPHAVAAAQGAGYTPHDASQLATDPTLDGFYLDLPGRRGLIVCRDPRAKTVSSLDLVENWDGGKAGRVYHDVRSFDLPPAPGRARAQ